MEVIKPSKQSITKAIETLNAGGVVVCPTDTVYGFLALANPPAGGKKVVEKIFKIKKRHRTKPLPIFIRDLKMAKKIAEISPRQEKIIKKHWPGKFTFVLKLRSKKDTIGQFYRIVPMVIGKNNTIAMRVPKYKFLNDLLKKIGKPLAQTSVNISNNPPMTKFGEIIKAFGKNKNIDMIIDGGNLPKTKPSAIIDLTGNKINILRK